MPWRHLPDCDMDRITGTINSKERLFSDVTSNRRLEGVANVLHARRAFDARYPKSLAVYKRAARARAASVEPAAMTRLWQPPGL